MMDERSKMEEFHRSRGKFLIGDIQYKCLLTFVGGGGYYAKVAEKQMEFRQHKNGPEGTTNRRPNFANVVFSILIGVTLILQAGFLPGISVPGVSH